MKKSALAANRAVALNGFDFSGCENGKPHPAAMAATVIFDQGRISRSHWQTKRLRSRFHLLGITTAACRAVHFRPMIEYALGRSDVPRLALPRFQCRILQGACIGEAHLPGMGTEFIHCVKMLRSTHRALAARQKSDPGNRRRHGALQTLNCPLSDLLHTGLPRIVLSGDHHAWLQNHPLETYAL